MSETVDNQPVYHIPALLPETLAALDIKPGGTYVDATLGGGGHTRAILAELGPEGRLLGFDQDSDALASAPQDERFVMVHGNFRYLRNFLRYYDALPVDGILADLGVSFHHFDDTERGFSFRGDARLDMRMNRQSTLTAARLLADSSEERLAEILKLYGELPRARQMAAAIVKARAVAPVDTVNRLLSVLKPLLDPRRQKKELACVFQALRIEVNGELDALREFLTQTLTALRPGGRLAIITYHSLEDRLVKNFMRAGNFEGRVHTDIYGRPDAPLRPLSGKPVTASEAEVVANPRSRSAKLRVAVRVGEAEG